LFSDQDLLVLAQPTFDDSDLYWKSIEDFLLFTANVASIRARIPGKTLLELFAAAKPAIMSVRDFSNPSIPFEEILGNMTNRYCSEAGLGAITQAESEMREIISGFDADRLREGLNPELIARVLNTCLRNFEDRAQELFPHLLDFEAAVDQRSKIQLRLQRFSDDAFVERCLVVLGPVLCEEALRDVQMSIAGEMDRLSVAEVGAFPFSELCARFQNGASTHVSASAVRAHAGIDGREEFVVLLSNLRRAVAGHVCEVESTRRKEFAAAVAADRQRRNEEIDSVYRGNLEKMERSQAEHLREIERQRDEAERCRQEEQDKQRLASEQQKATLAALLEQQKEHREAMIAAAERANEQTRMMNELMLAETTAARERQDRERFEEQKHRAERETALIGQITQLGVSQAVVVKQSKNWLPSLASAVTTILPAAKSCNFA
jgi:hypothetical protein